MPTVEVRGVGPFQKIFGHRHLSVEVPANGTLQALIGELDRRFDGQIGGHLLTADGAWSDRVRIFLNGRDVRFLGPNDPALADGDIVLFLPVLAGG